MDILRFITAGNVDDGKSTLIGRLLYDTHNIKTDVLSSVTEKGDTGTRNDGSHVNLAYITDGLRTEREQGITIDVAYKYFTTPGRKYIITDAPGHFQFTRNLVTGASAVDAMIILIDARHGITEQTRRHLLVASFLRIAQVVVAINKMDLVGYEQGVFDAIRQNMEELGDQLGLPFTFVPVSALLGDFISARSERMDWYRGPTLLEYLEACTARVQPSFATRFEVQYVISFGKTVFETGYAGKLLSGGLLTGEPVGLYPAGKQSVVSSIMHGYEIVSKADAGQNLVVYLSDGVSAGRGDILSPPGEAPRCTTEWEANVCWLDAASPLVAGKNYVLRINAIETGCKITNIICKRNVHTFRYFNDASPVVVNEFARVKIVTRLPVAIDNYAVIPPMGRGIIIDAETNYTSGAFVI